MLLGSRKPITYHEAVTLIYETYWGTLYGKVYIEDQLKTARERRILDIEGNYYYITGPIGPDRFEDCDYGEQLALAT